MKFIKYMVAGLVGVVLVGTVMAQTTNTYPTVPPATNAPVTHIVSTGTVQVIAGTITQDALNWIGSHGSVGAEYCGPVKSGTNGGTGPAATETGWLLDVPWTSNGTTNIDSRLGLLHSDIVCKTLTQDQLGVELAESFFNQNLAVAVQNVPILKQAVGFLQKYDATITGSVAHNTGALATGNISDKKMDWGVGLKLIQLF